MEVMTDMVEVGWGEHIIVFPLSNVSLNPLYRPEEELWMYWEMLRNDIPGCITWHWGTELHGSCWVLETLVGPGWQQGGSRIVKQNNLSRHTGEGKGAEDRNSFPRPWRRNLCWRPSRLWIFLARQSSLSLPPHPLLGFDMTYQVSQSPRSHNTSNYFNTVSCILVVNIPQAGTQTRNTEQEHHFPEELIFVEFLSQTDGRVCRWDWQ